MQPNIKKGFWISLIVSERKVKKTPTTLKKELKVFIIFSSKTPVKKFILLRLYYDMTLACAR